MKDAGIQKVRGQNRIRLEGEVRSRRSGRHAYPTQIMNLSPGGCCIELPFGAMVGDRLWVTLPGLSPIEARVAWSDRSLTGCAFETPIYEPVFEQLRERFGV